MNTENKDERYNLNNDISKNSRRILYVAVIVACLFVAVISGTFAYFTASVTDSTTISGTVSKTSLSLDVTKLDYTKEASHGTDLIPLETNSYNDINKALTNSCVDKYGYTACQVYRIAVNVPANNSRMPITGKVNLTAVNDSYLPNLTYTILKKQSIGNFPEIITDLTTTEPYYLLKKNIGEDLIFTDIDKEKNGFLEATSEATTYNYYLIVWLEDSGIVQNDIDYGDFSGVVTIESAGGNITATFD